MTVVAVSLRALLAVVLAWSALGKVTPGGFGSTVAMLGQLGVDRRAQIAAAGLIGAEGGVAGLLLVPATTTVGSVAAVGLLAALTGAVIVLVRRDADVRCACFGAGRTPIGPVHVVRNGVLLGCAATSLVLASSAPAGEIDLAGLVGAIGAGALVAVTLARLDDLTFLFARSTRH